MLLAQSADNEYNIQEQETEKECNQQDLLVRRHGGKRAMLIRRRLDELKAAQNLDIMRFLASCSLPRVQSRPRW